MGCFCSENLQTDKYPEVPVSARPGQESLSSCANLGILIFGGLMSQEQVVRQEAFEDLELQVIEQSGEEWFSAEDIGKALGYEQPRIYVMKLFNRNRDEFEGLYRVVSLGTWLKTGLKVPYRFTTFNPQGAYLLAILARTPKSKALRRWLAKFMAHDLNRLKEHVGELEARHLADQEKIKRLVGKLGVTTRKLKKLQGAPKALPTPETAAAYQLEADDLQVVRINYSDLVALVERGGYEPPYTGTFLTRVVHAQLTPEQDMQDLRGEYLTGKLCQARQPA